MQASPPRQSPGRSQGRCAKLPQGRPPHSVPALGTRLLQLSEPAAGERGASLLFLATSSVSSRLRRILVGSPVPGSGDEGRAGEGVVPIHQHWPLSLPPSLLSSPLSCRNRKGQGAWGWGWLLTAGPILPPPGRPREGVWPQPSVISLGNGFLSISLATAVGRGTQFWGNWEVPLHASLVVYGSSPLWEHRRGDLQLDTTHA